MLAHRRFFGIFIFIVIVFFLFLGYGGSRGNYFDLLTGGGPFDTDLAIGVTMNWNQRPERSYPLDVVLAETAILKRHCQVLALIHALSLLRGVLQSRLPMRRPFGQSGEGL